MSGPLRPNPDSAFSGSFHVPSSLVTNLMVCVTVGQLVDILSRCEGINCYQRMWAFAFPLFTNFPLEIEHGIGSQRSWQVNLAYVRHFKNS